MKTKVLVCALALTTAITGLSAGAVLHPSASVINKDLHPELGKPAMVVSEITPLESVDNNTLKKLNNVKSGTVVRLQAGGYLDLGTRKVKVDTKKFVIGDDLDSYAVDHPEKFAKKLKTTKMTYLYDPESYERIAVVNAGTEFLISDNKQSDKDFYVVTFDDRKALLYKGDAVTEIYVQVTYLNDVKESLREIYKKMLELANDLGISLDDLEYSTEAGNTVVEFAKQCVGNPYVWGGTSLTDGCDCSGFVQQVYKHYGIDLPRCSASQSKVGKMISRDNLQPGDLLFFNRGSGIGHVAMYAGDGMIVHAKGSKYGIVLEPLKEAPVVCRRYIEDLED